MPSASDDTVPLSMEEMAANAATVAMAGRPTSWMLESASSTQTQFVGSINATLDDGLPPQQLPSLPDQGSIASGSRSPKDRTHVTGSTSASNSSTTTTSTGRPSRTRKLTAKAVTKEHQAVVEERRMPVKLPTQYRYLCSDHECKSGANIIPELRRHMKEKHPQASPLKEEDVNKIDYKQWLASGWCSAPVNLTCTDGSRRCSSSYLQQVQASNSLRKGTHCIKAFAIYRQ